MRRSPWSRAITLALAFVLACTSVLAVPQTAEAAAKPTKITLSANKRTLYLGKSFTLKVKSVKPANASKDVTFKSSNTKVATVSSKGKVKGIKVGKATITATSKSNKKVKATCKITVKQQVESISVTNSIRRRVVVPKGKTLTLKTVVKPDNAANKGLNYIVGNPKIVTVNANGKIKAKKYGSNRIAIQSKDKQKRLVIVVYVPKVRIKSAALNTTKKSLDIGKTYKLKGIFKPSNASVKVVSFTSSNPKVASVGIFGKVKALSPGKSVITMTTLDGKKKAKCTITVNPIKVTGVTVIPESQELFKGQQFTVSARIAPSNATNQSVTWKSSNTSVVSVTQAGQATAVGVGEAEITATAKDGSGKSGKCKVTVAPESGKVLIRSIKVVPPETSLKVGESTVLEAQITLDDGSVVTEKDKDKYPLNWVSDRPDVATVEPETGKVTAIAVGKANINAVACDGSKEIGTCVVEVKAADPSVAPVITLSEEKISLQAGKEKDLTWTVTPEGTPVTWSSNNEAVATVKEGKVKAVKAGTAIITASVKGGNTASCEVNVTSDKPEITMTEVEVNLQVGGSVSLKWAVSPAGTGVDWSSDHPEYASVKDGIITAHAVGTAIITGSVAGGNSVTCTVNVIPGKADTPEILLAEEEINLEVGSQTTLKWSVKPENADVSWSSREDAIASVKEGTITAHKVGTTTITASVAGGNSVACTVNVTEPKQEDNVIILTQAKVSLLVGETLVPQYSVKPEGAKVEWSVDRPEIATVDAETGMITAVSQGRATVTAKVQGSDNAVTCIVDVKEPEKPEKPEIILTEIEVNLQVGNRTTLRYEVKPAGTEVIWTSKDENIATVSNNGEIEAISEGQTTVTAEVPGGNKVICTVNVLSPNAEIRLEEEKLNLVAGISRKLTWVTKPENAKVEWTSSDETVATVSEGVVKAIKAGEATITGTVAGSGASASCIVTVTGISISLNEKEITLKANQEGIQLTATLLPEELIEAIEKGEAFLTWKSSDESVAEVSDTGFVRPREVGESEIVDPIRTARVTATVQIVGEPAAAAAAECIVTVVTEKNSQVIDEENFIYMLGEDAVAYRIVRGNEEYEVTKANVVHDLALFTQKLDEVKWDNNFVKDYWNRFNTEMLQESELLALLFLSGKPEIKDINASTKEITMRGRTAEVVRVDGQDSSSLIITDKNGGRQAYIEDIQATSDGSDVKITAQMGASATGKRMGVELTMSMNGNITFSRLVNDKVHPIATFSQVGESFEFKVSQMYYDEFVDMFGTEFDFLNQLEIYNVYI